MSGIAALRNLKTDRVWLFWADDIQKASIENRFKLDMGVHPCASLQEDYTKTGLEVFRFETVKETEDKSDFEKIVSGFENRYE